MPAIHHPLAVVAIACSFVLASGCQRKADPIAAASEAAASAAAGAASATQTMYSVLTQPPSLSFAIRVAQPGMEAGDERLAAVLQPEGDEIAAMEASRRLRAAGRCNEAKKMTAGSGAEMPYLRAVALQNRVRDEVESRPALLEELRKTVESSRQVGIARVLVIAEGLAAKPPFAVPEPLVQWGVAHGLSQATVEGLFIAGVRRSLSPHESGCGIALVLPNSDASGESFVSRLHQANVRYVQTMTDATPTPTGLQRGEFETTPAFEDRKAATTKAHAEAVTQQAQQLRSVQDVNAADALTSQLQAITLSDVRYDADAQAFIGELVSKDGSLHIPVRLKSKLEDAPVDKELLKAASLVTMEVRVADDGELIFSDFALGIGGNDLTKPRFLLLDSTAWKTGVHFGRAALEQQASVLKLQVAAVDAQKHVNALKSQAAAAAEAERAARAPVQEAAVSRTVSEQVTAQRSAPTADDKVRGIIRAYRKRGGNCGAMADDLENDLNAGNMAWFNKRVANTAQYCMF